MADYYGSVAAADTYHSDRGNSAWTGTNSVKIAALIRATMYIDATYKLRFIGYRTNRRDQDLEWPRADAYDEINGQTIPSDEVPIEVEYATYEGALRELVSPGSLNPDVTFGKIKEEVSIYQAVSVKYAKSNSALDQKPIIGIIEGLLANVLKQTVYGGLFAKSVRG